MTGLGPWLCENERNAERKTNFCVFLLSALPKNLDAVMPRGVFTRPGSNPEVTASQPRWPILPNQQTLRQRLPEITRADHEKWTGRMVGAPAHHAIVEAAPEGGGARSGTRLNSSLLFSAILAVHQVHIDQVAWFGQENKSSDSQANR
jgi:hypothetical protein